MNQKLIKQLQNGEIAVKNDGTLEELRKVLKEAFPLDSSVNTIKGSDTVYNAKSYSYNNYGVNNPENLPEYSIKDFFKPYELSLEELIESVKKKAKDEGFNCDVVLDEIGKFDVEIISQSRDFRNRWWSFDFKLNYIPPNDQDSAGEHLAKCLKEYLEKY